MSINELMTPLMDKFREKTSLTDSLTVQRATGLMDHLKLIVNPNLITKTTFKTDGVGSWSMWTTRKEGLKLNPGTYTVSWQAKSSGSFKHVRIRLYDIANASTFNHIVGPFAGKVFPLTDKRQSYTFTLPGDFTYDVCFYSGDIDNGENIDAITTFYNVKLEVGDLATPLTEVGG